VAGRFSLFLFAGSLGSLNCACQLPLLPAPLSALLLVSCRIQPNLVGSSGPTIWQRQFQFCDVYVWGTSQNPRIVLFFWSVFVFFVFCACASPPPPCCTTNSFYPLFDPPGRLTSACLSAPLGSPPRAAHRRPWDSVFWNTIISLFFSLFFYIPFCFQ